MTDVAALGLSVDSRELVAATEALHTFAEAAKRADEALTRLAAHGHGGIEIKVVGALATVRIEPRDADNGK